MGVDNKLERVAFLELLQPAAPLADEIEDIDALLAQQRGGAFTIEEAVERFVRRRGVAEPEPYVERYKERCVELVETFVVGEFGARALCEDLIARSIPHAVLTNGWSPLQQQKAQKVGFFGPVLVSSDIGMQKPSLEAFTALTRELGCRPEETAYVGDTPESDIAGALAAGLFAVWYDTEKRTYPSGLPQPSRVIHTLAELGELL